MSTTTTPTPEPEPTPAPAPAPAPAPEPAPAPAAPSFHTLFGEILERLEEDVPAISGLAALWHKQTASGGVLYDADRELLAVIHGKVHGSEPVTAEPAPVPLPMAPEHTITGQSDPTSAPASGFAALGSAPPAPPPMPSKASKE